jgi:hypothetical protein
MPPPPGADEHDLGLDLDSFAIHAGICAPLLLSAQICKKHFYAISINYVVAPRLLSWGLPVRTCRIVISVRRIKIAFASAYLMKSVFAAAQEGMGVPGFIGIKSLHRYSTGFLRVGRCHDSIRLPLREQV